MKNLRLTLGIAAIAIGSFAAFSFAPTSNVNDETTGEFYVSPNGSMGLPVDPAHPCEGAGPLCSQEYNIETGEPTDNPALIKNGVKRP
ncbi:MAG: hypothetical protein LBF27_06075 [Sphingobacterium sp.]|nr:hypothetical protein [Sphingobacterium sp.]